MGFAPFGIGLLMGLLTLTAYACCAAGDADRDYPGEIEIATEQNDQAPRSDGRTRGLRIVG